MVFVQKLFQVYKMDNNNLDEDLIRIITKTTILTLFSICFTIIANIVGQITAPWEEKDDDIAIFLLTRGLFAMDVFTNFICFVLTYQSFDKYYSIFCGFCHSKCRTMCQCIDIGGRRGRELHRMQTNTASV